MSQVLDLDKVIPEEKILKLGGKEFDLTIIPFEIPLQVYELIPMIETLEKGEIKLEDYEKILELIYQALSVSDKNITKEWVKSQINIERFMQLVPFIFSSMFNPSKKNEGEAGSQTST